VLPDYPLRNLHQFVEGQVLRICYADKRLCYLVFALNASTTDSLAPRIARASAAAKLRPWGTQKIRHITTIRSAAEYWTFEELLMGERPFVLFITTGTPGYAAPPARWTHGAGTYVFCTPNALLPIGTNIFTCISGVDIAPTQLDPKGFSVSASVSVTLQDFAHHDRGVDPYTDNRAYTPAEQGTFFGKLRARNPYPSCYA
jgi:hypothetical protein